MHTIFEKLREEGLPLHDTTFIKFMSGSFPGVAWEQKDTHSTHGTYHIPVRREAHCRRAALTLTTDCLCLVGGSYSYLAMHFTLYGNGGRIPQSVISDILIVITGILQIGSLSCEYDSHLCYLVTVTIVTGFPCLIPTEERVSLLREALVNLLTRSGTMATKYVRSFLHILYSQFCCWKHVGISSSCPLLHSLTAELLNYLWPLSF